MESEEISHLSRYPFLTRASEYVASRNYAIAEILTSRGFDLARGRARSRVLQALKGAIISDATNPDIAELLSYPIARIIVSCIDDPFLTRPYALAEAKLANERMGQEKNHETLQEIGRDFNINATITLPDFNVHFTDYVRGAAGLRALEWKLVNRRLESGYVNITKMEYARLLQEAIRGRILAALPLKVPAAFCDFLKEYIDEIKINLEERKSQYSEEGLGEVEPQLFPPCIIHLLSAAQSGTNLAHSSRFSLTSFLLNIGLSVDQIVQMFNVSPDFNEEMTRYQVEHISGATGTVYKSPSCATMITYGNCYGKNELCKYIGHPLSYYRKLKQKRESEPAEKTKNGEQDK